MENMNASVNTLVGGKCTHTVWAATVVAVKATAFIKQLAPSVVCHANREMTHAKPRERTTLHGFISFLGPLYVYDDVLHSHGFHHPALSHGLIAKEKQKMENWDSLLAPKNSFINSPHAKLQQ